MLLPIQFELAAAVFLNFTLLFRLLWLLQLFQVLLL